MLEFIVLGQIPGTAIQITFKGVLIIAATLLATYDFLRIVRRKQTDHTEGHSKKVTA